MGVRSQTTIDPAYHDHAEVNAELLTLQSAYPALARRVDLNTWLGSGLTWGGRTTYALKISDNAAIDEDEPAVLMCGGLHAREVINVELCLDHAARILAGYGIDPALTSLVDDHEVWIVPVCNPDGLAYAQYVDPYWRKNRRDNGDGTFGVDLNRNFPFQWNACGTSPSTVTSSIYYVGPSPGSEPETQLLLDLMNELRPAKVFDMHSRGREIFYRYGCSSWDSQIQGLHQSILSTAVGLMGYSGPNASSSGGFLYKQAIRDHGALGCIVETYSGPNWWPAYPTAVAEINQVWPGSRFMLTTPIPLTGRLVDGQNGRPVSATFTVGGIALPPGHVATTDPETGRFHAWLPPGVWTLHVNAPGYFPASPTLAVNPGQNTDVVLAMTPQLGLSALVPQVGTPHSATLSAPAAPLHPVIWGVSHGTTPGTLLPDGRIVPLNFDALLTASVTGVPPFGPFVGHQTDAAGVDVLTWLVPPLPSLAGQTFSLSAVVMDPVPSTTDVRYVFPALTFTVQP